MNRLQEAIAGLPFMAADVPEATAEDAVTSVADEAALSVNEVLDAYPDFGDIWRRLCEDVLWSREQRERIRNGDISGAAVEARRRYLEGGSEGMED